MKINSPQQKIKKTQSLTTIITTEKLQMMLGKTPKMAWANAKIPQQQMT